MVPITPKNTLVKTENPTVWTNALKKDPRQRIKPKPEEVITPNLV